MRGFLRLLLKPFHPHCKVCVINENKSEVNHAIKLIERHSLVADGFTDYKKLLLNLHTHNRYSVIIIHENGSKAKPNMLAMFIHQLNPNLPVIVYNTTEQLEKQLQAFC